MDDLQKERLESVKSGKAKPGKAALIKYLTGGRVTQIPTIAAKCYDCNGMGDSDSCCDTACPLYPYSPYGSFSRRGLGKHGKKQTIV